MYNVNSNSISNLIISWYILIWTFGYVWKWEFYIILPSIYDASISLELNSSQWQAFCRSLDLGKGLTTHFTGNQHSIHVMSWGPGLRARLHRNSRPPYWCRAHQPCSFRPSMLSTCWAHVDLRFWTMAFFKKINNPSNNKLSTISP